VCSTPPPFLCIFYSVVCLSLNFIGHTNISAPSLLNGEFYNKTSPLAQQGAGMRQSVD
jgi:hypothetical protein